MALTCPHCATRVEPPADGAPVCPTCGFGARKPLVPVAPPGQTGSAGPVLRSRDAPSPGRLRSVSIGNAMLFGGLTLGIYTWVLAFKMSGDLHRAPGGWPRWKLFFWLSFIPWVGAIFELILYFKNNKQANIMRAERGLSTSYLPFILLFIPFVSIAADRKSVV